MRINKYVARATGLSRRKADAAIAEGRVTVAGRPATPGTEATEEDHVSLDGRQLQLPQAATTIVLNKPVGYVCSRSGQGSRTVYDLLPAELHSLKPVGRLDKDSSGLLLMTDDGDLAQRLTHPRFEKQKVYEITLDRPLVPTDKAAIEAGIPLEDGPSRLYLSSQGREWLVTMHEGRNRQIRRTFAAMGYEVVTLHRTVFGDYSLSDLKTGDYATTEDSKVATSAIN